MKIPDDEMPKRYSLSEIQLLPWQERETPFVEFSAYQRLYNERRFIPVEECSPWVRVEDRLPEHDDLYQIFGRIAILSPLRVSIAYFNSVRREFMRPSPLGTLPAEEVVFWATLLDPPDYDPLEGTGFEV